MEKRIVYMKRENNIELLRIIAFIMVVFIHVTPNGLTLPDGIAFHSTSWYYATLIRCLVNPAISLFILISGYVTYFNKDKYSIKSTLKKLLIPLAVYLPVLFSINIMLNGWTWKSVLDNFYMIITITGPFHHLWYIYAYVFVIIFTPFIIGGIEKYNKKNDKGWLLVVILLGIVGITEILVSVFNIPAFNLMLSNNIVYLTLMFMAGYYINKYDFKISNKSAYILIYVVTFIINYLIFFKINKYGEPFTFVTIANNFNIFNIIQSITIFLFFKELNIKKLNIYTVSKYSYGAYLIHTFWIFYIQKYYPFLSYVKESNYYLYDLFFVFLVVVASLLTEVLRKGIVKIYKLLLKRRA